MAIATAADGVRLYYEEAGSGDPLIFVYEFAGDHRSFEPQVRFFSRRYRWPDLRRTRLPAFRRAG